MAEAPRHRVQLWSIKRPDLTSVLHAGFNEADDLVLAGQDIGAFVEQSFGGDEYEYWYTVRQPVIEKLGAELAQVTREPAPQGEELPPFVTESIRKLYAGPEHGVHFTSSSAFAKWMNERGISSEFSSWP